MTATQTKIRRDTKTNIDATTPAEGEVGYDTTNKRLLVGDGSVAGGHPHASWKDVQNRAFTSGTVGGTGDAITLTLAPGPGSYAANQGFTFKAGANNTGATTININGLGVKTLKKRSGGSLADLEADDLINGGTYTITYDGTYFQVETLNHSSGLISVSQGDLNTSTGTISSLGTFTNSGGNSIFVALAAYVGSGNPSTTYTARLCSFDVDSAGAISGPVNATLPGGEYGFFPQTKIVTGLPSSQARIDAQQRYISASPPFDLGDGEVGGFIFVLVNPAGEIVAHYAADVPPWAYNGPTDIRAVKKDPITKKKYRRVMVARTLEEIMDGATISYKEEEITQAIKNADMHLIPHPFGDIPPGHKVVLLDPMDQRTRDLIDYQNAGGANEIAEAISGGKIRVDNTPLLNRKGPPGVMQARMQFKYTRQI